VSITDENFSRAARFRSLRLDEIDGPRNAPVVVIDSPHTSDRLARAPVHGAPPLRQAQTRRSQQLGHTNIGRRPGHGLQSGSSFVNTIRMCPDRCVTHVHGCTPLCPRASRDATSATCQAMQREPPAYQVLRACPHRSDTQSELRRRPRSLPGLLTRDNYSIVSRTGQHALRPVSFPIYCRTSRPMQTITKAWRGLSAWVLILGSLSVTAHSQGKTTPAGAPMGAAATAKIATFVAQAGFPTYAGQMTANPATIKIEFGTPAKGAKGSSGFKDGAFVVTVPAGTNTDDATGILLHELSHVLNQDPGNPAGQTGETLRQMFCIEARCNCDALSAIVAAAANDGTMSCAAVRRLQEDAYAFWIACQLGVGQNGPVSSLPCPNAQSGSVPCTGT